MRNMFCKLEEAIVQKKLFWVSVPFFGVNRNTLTDGDVQFE